MQKHKNEEAKDKTFSQDCLNLSDPEISLLKALRSLNYGAVEVTVHDSRIVQLQRTEKVRFGNETRS